MVLNSLEDLLAVQVESLLDGEEQLARAMPRIIAGTMSVALQRSLSAHLVETRLQIGRLEKMCEHLRIRTRHRVCRGVAGLVAEADEMLVEQCDPEIRDAGIIAVCERIEHYEMAFYGAALAFAEKVRSHVCIDILRQSLDEEMEQSRALVNIAAGAVNEEADAVANY